MEQVERVLNLQELLLQFRNTPRRVLLPGSSEFENDVDHSYFLTIISWYLAPKIDPTLDLDKIRKYALVHDFVEVHAGDTFAFDEAGRELKKQKEEEALIKIAQDWQDFPDLVQTIEAYESQSDRESKFVYALDKMMPAIISCLDEGRTWKMEALTFEKVHAYDSAKTAGSPELQEFFQELYSHLESNPQYFHQPES